MVFSFSVYVRLIGGVTWVTWVYPGPIPLKKTQAIPMDDPSVTARFKRIYRFYPMFFS